MTAPATTPARKPISADRFGVACPHCGSYKTRVLKTHRRVPGVTHRIRFCVECKRKMRTAERIVASSDRSHLDVDVDVAT
ncbi:hypothetical protein [Fuerstiella marisgermanici]|uniref:hypothetical protein n=1 Tax=Fuerstiella marisgermanici TaxID=1891926 RepID=UPI00097CB325|nr:hypothetical protein [Fuerstiella marisgermanici]